MAKKTQIKINPAALRKLERDVAAKLQPQADAALRDTIRTVSDRMAGQPADDVYAALLAALAKTFPTGFKPNEQALRKVAAEIAASPPQ